MTPGAGGRGQASLEVIALIPVLIVAALAGVQVVSLLAAASSAQDEARRRAMAATGAPGQWLTLTGSERPPRLAVFGGRAAPVGVRVMVRLP
jgi:hypothetical protein